jgi:hypothetical protein
MAFIREYAAGDPFFKKLRKKLKPPKALRKIGRVLGTVAPIAAALVPGLGVAALAARAGTVGRAVRAYQGARKRLHPVREAYARIRAAEIEPDEPDYSTNTRESAAFDYEPEIIDRDEEYEPEIFYDDDEEEE